MALLAQLSWVFLKIGTFTFGGGIVIVPLVENEVVLKYGWLTKQEFIDAITLGQITPGPVIISATFIGFKVAGVLGALAATISVILPSFIMICLATIAVAKFRKNRTLAAFFGGARIAVIGLVFEAALSIGSSSITSMPTIFIAFMSLVFLLFYKVNPAFVFVGAGVIGFLI